MTSTPPSPLSSAAPATSFGEVGPDGTVFLRLPDGSQREVGQWPAQAAAIVECVRKSVLEPSFVGDMAALVARIGQLEVLINVKKESLAEAKEANKKSALEAREKLVAEAEKLADSKSWKVTTERFTAIVEEWKAIPRYDRAKENELWKQISSARTTFDKARRAHYCELDATRTQAKDAKEKLVKKAQELIDMRGHAQLPCNSF